MFAAFVSNANKEPSDTQKAHCLAEECAMCNLSEYEAEALVC